MPIDPANTLLWLLAFLLVIVGLFGLVLPALPGAALIFAGLLVAAWADDFARVGAFTLILIGVIAALSYGIDLVAAAAGAKRWGASPRGVAGAALGTLFGLFLGLPGLILGPFIGAVLGELTLHRDLSRAGKVGLQAWIGFALGTGVKIALAMSMIAIFVAAYFVF
jgi:uncharacterized protein YqgC (DUF456 family)